jgi:hypothetical protein
MTGEIDMNVKFKVGALYNGDRKRFFPDFTPHFEKDEATGKFKFVKPDPQILKIREGFIAKASAYVDKLSAFVDAFEDVPAFLNLLEEFGDINMDVDIAEAILKGEGLMHIKITGTKHGESRKWKLYSLRGYVNAVKALGFNWLEVMAQGDGLARWKFMFNKLCDKAGISEAKRTQWYNVKEIKQTLKDLKKAKSENWHDWHELLEGEFEGMWTAGEFSMDRGGLVIDQDSAKWWNPATKAWEIHGHDTTTLVQRKNAYKSYLWHRSLLTRWGLAKNIEFQPYVSYDDRDEDDQSVLLDNIPEIYSDVEQEETSQDEVMDTDVEEEEVA